MLYYTRVIASLAFSWFLLSNVYSQSYTSLEVNCPEYASDSLKIGCYYGTTLIAIDTLVLNNVGYASYTNINHEGIYLISTPDSLGFEFMVSDSGHYSMSKKNNDFILEANAVSKAFDTHYKATLQTQNYINSLHNDSLMQIEIKRNTQGAKRNLKETTRQLSEQYQGTFLGNYLKILLPVEMPEFQVDRSADNADSLYWATSLSYYRKHYLDNIDWADYRLMYTPFVEQKLNEYLNKILPQNKSALISGITAVIDSIPDGPMQSYCIEKIAQHFEHKKHLAFNEFMYLHVLNNYYFTDTTLQSNSNFTAYQNDYKRLSISAIGSTAPNFELPDKTEQYIGLTQTKAKNTILVFWDFTCPMCRQVMDEFTVMMRSFSNKGIKVITIYTGSDMVIWRAMAEKKLSQDWYNLYQTKNTNIATKYNITQLPAIFLLDEQNIILNKSMAVPQLKEYLDANGSVY